MEKPFKDFKRKCIDCGDYVTHGIMYCNKHLNKWFGPLETVEENARRKRQNTWVPPKREIFHLDEPIYLSEAVRVVTDDDQFMLERLHGVRWRRISFARSREGLIGAVVHK